MTGAACTMQAGSHTITAAEPLADDLRVALDRLRSNLPQARPVDDLVHRDSRYQDGALADPVS